MTNYTELIEQLKSGKSTYLDRQAVTAIEALVAERDTELRKNVHLTLQAEQYKAERDALRAELDAIKPQSGPDYEDGPDSEGFSGPRPWNGFQTTNEPAPEKQEPKGVRNVDTPDHTEVMRQAREALAGVTDMTEKQLVPKAIAAIDEVLPK